MADATVTCTQPSQRRIVTLRRHDDACVLHNMQWLTCPQQGVHAHDAWLAAINGTHHKQHLGPNAPKAATKYQANCEQAAWDECAVSQRRQQVVECTVQQERRDVEGAMWRSKQSLYLESLWVECQDGQVVVLPVAATISWKRDEA